LTSMHPKNPFIQNYDLEKLSDAYPPLKDHIITNKYGNQSVKFGNAKAVLALNTAILKFAYGIDWHLPAKNLCPPIPGRLDYLLHISDLLGKPAANILDIGTGANLIYPILGTCHFNWQCAASESDQEAMDHAKNIIDQNEILDKIDLRLQKDPKKILDHIITEKDEFDAVICNPPFYKNKSEAEKNQSRKRKNLNLGTEKNFSGDANELWYPGGEASFVKKMAQESIHYKYQVNWFTSLVSSKETLKEISRAINAVKPKSSKVIEMNQGNKQSRFIAWTFQ